MKKSTPDLNYLGPSENARNVILAALMRMPDEIVDFASEKVLFTSLGGPGNICALTLPPGVAAERWIVALLEAPAEDPEEAMTTVAEEVAHAWLGHRYDDPPENAEAAASALVRSWGFRGPTTADPSR